MNTCYDGVLRCHDVMTIERNLTGIIIIGNESFGDFSNTALNEQLHMIHGNKFVKFSHL